MTDDTAKLEISSATTDCVCGALIRKVWLPLELVGPNKGELFLWVHANTNDTLCYPDDQEIDGNPALAEPYV